MLIYLLIGILIASLFYLINTFLYFSSRNRLSRSDLMVTYECGFEAVQNQARTERSVSYYLIALLYVIFDLEIALILPALISLNLLGISGGILLILIMSFLTFPFVYELRLGAFNHVNPIQ